MPIAEPRPARLRSLGARLRDDDAALVWRVQAGDERAFAAIFKRHHAPLLSYCRHMLGNRDEGEDALQQALIKAHQALLGGTTPRELRPWLYAIARNCCLSAIATRRPTASLEDHTQAFAGLSDEVCQREDLRELLAAIGRLPEDQRSALLLAELDDLSHNAIATVVGCPVSKVKALVYQARSALIADRDARGTPCQDIREQLSTAHGGELRRGPLRRHLKLCAGCRDFQLAVNAQRQSLAAVLPVLPSAGLVSAILGHGSVHAAGAAGIGGAGAGAAPAASAAGAGTGVAGVTAGGVTASGGGGIVAGSATVGATTAVGAGSGGGASIGALVGGGLITKLAVGGSVLALAAAGAAAVHRRSVKAIPSRGAHTQLASFAAHTSEAVAIADANDGLDGVPAPGAPAALSGASDPTGSAGLASLTGLASSTKAQPAPILDGTSSPDSASRLTSGQPTVKAGQGSGSESSPAKARKARLELRRAAHRRRARRLRNARRRAHLRNALRKALRRSRHPAKPRLRAPSKPRTSAVAPASMLVRHRKAHPTPVTLSTPAATNLESDSKEGKGLRHRSPAGAGAESTGSPSADSGTDTTSTDTASSTGTGKVGAGTGKAGAGTEKVSSEVDTGAGTGKTGSEVDTGTGSANSPADAPEPSATATQANEATGAGARSRQGTTQHPRKPLLEEEQQLPNL